MTSNTPFYLNKLSLALAVTLFASAPSFAQSHDAHANHTDDTKPAASMADHHMNGPSKMDHSKMDHAAMKMDHAAMMSKRAAHMVEVSGILMELDPNTREATIQHAAIPEVSWPAATMIFPVGPKVDLSGLMVGRPVQFTLHRAPNGSLPLVELCQTQSLNVVPGHCAGKMNHDMMGHGAMSSGGMTHEGHAMPHSGASDLPQTSSPMDHAAHGTHD
ncbi:MAG: copper-binding protein [Litorimonas sp.]